MCLSALLVGRRTIADRSASFREDLRPDRRARKVSALCIEFDALWEASGFPPIALVKIDTEGTELEVLSGMVDCLERSRPPVVCEVLRADRYADRDQHDLRLSSLESLLFELRYAIHPVVHGRKRACIEREEIAGFPRGPWTRSHRRRCDYVFLPMPK